MTPSKIIPICEHGLILPYHRSWIRKWGELFAFQEEACQHRDHADNSFVPAPDSHILRCDEPDFGDYIWFQLLAIKQ